MKWTSDAETWLKWNLCCIQLFFHSIFILCRLLFGTWQRTVPAAPPFCLLPFHIFLFYFFWGHKTEKWNAAWSSSSSSRNYAHWAFLLVLKFSAFSTWHLAMDFPRAWWITLHALSLAKVWWLPLSQQKSLLLLKKMFVCGFLIAVWHKSTFLVECFWGRWRGKSKTHSFATISPSVSKTNHKSNVKI